MVAASTAASRGLHCACSQASSCARGTAPMLLLQASNNGSSVRVVETCEPAQRQLAHHCWQLSNPSTVLFQLLQTREGIFKAHTCHTHCRGPSWPRLTALPVQLRAQPQQHLQARCVLCWSPRHSSSRNPHWRLQHRHRPLHSCCGCRRVHRLLLRRLQLQSS